MFEMLIEMFEISTEMYEISTEMFENWTEIFEISSNKSGNFGYIWKICPSEILSDYQFKSESVKHPSLDHS